MSIFPAMQSNRFLLGIDIGSSSVKASLVHADTGKSVASAQSPSEEMAMIAVKPGWAEQEPELWWEHVILSVRMCIQKSGVSSPELAGIGISYQMHGLVVTGKDHKPLRPSIIWCDSRAVEIGEKAFKSLGKEFCLSHYLNSPGNFTASKLKWVKENEPSLFEKVNKFMLPGDYIAMKLTGETVTTDTGLSEGIFWDFPSNGQSEDILKEYGFSKDIVPKVVPVFSVQGKVNESAAAELGISKGVPVSYRAGDQPNNAFSLNVTRPGETAATAGTSGVIYGVTDTNAFDPKSRVNTFVHVNNRADQKRNGVLLCINGTGILNSWLRKSMKSKGDLLGYDEINQLAAKVPIGSDGLQCLPFGNGAERILENKDIKSSMHGIDFNHHSQAHLFRAAQEGIVFSLKYGFDILQDMGLKTKVIRAGHANMFLSPVFREAFVNTIGADLELYDTDGAKGAALGAGVGAGIYASTDEAFKGLKLIESKRPDVLMSEQYLHFYNEWKQTLIKEI